MCPLSMYREEDFIAAPVIRSNYHLHESWYQDFFPIECMFPTAVETFILFLSVCVAKLILVIAVRRYVLLLVTIKLINSFLVQNSKNYFCTPVSNSGL